MLCTPHLQVQRLRSTVERALCTHTILLLSQKPWSRLFSSARAMAMQSFEYPFFPGAWMPSTCHALASMSSLLRLLHTTTSRKGAAPKLKEVPVDVCDDIDVTKPADYNPSNFDPQESRSRPSEKIVRIVDEIAHLTLLEASDLSYLLKKKLGLPDSAMPYYGGGMGVGMGVSQGGASPAAQEEKKPEKTNFDVKLEKFEAASKIKVIKEVRAFTSLGLKEAKELVEKLPAVVKAGVAKEEAEQMVEKLKAVGATAILE